jgi:predicted secreted protein
METTMLFIRRAMIVLAALSGIVTPVHAGEFAEFRPLGFSADGKVFGFEEFGIQDGSGFAFANRFFINTTTDEFLPGSTVRVILEDESSTIAQARAQAAAQSATIEAEYRLADNPGVIAAFNPLSELDSDPGRLRYEPFSMKPQPFGPSTLQLTEKPLSPSALCEQITPTATGFRLELTEYNGQPVSIVLNDDMSVPASRGCPTAYRLGGVVTHFADGVWTHAVLVLIRSFGFEGEDGRWIAVTRRFE